MSRDPERPLVHPGVVGQRVAGSERDRGPAGVDLRRTLPGIAGGQQALGRHVDEVGVGVVGVAVRVGQLHRLDHGVDVVGAVVAHRLQVELLEDVQRLQQHRALAVEAVLVDGVAAVLGGRRLLDAGVELGEVVELERGAVLLQEGDHLLGDVALVEAVAGGGDALLAAQMGVFPLGLHHPREGGGEGGERDGLARRVQRPVRLQPEPLIVRPRPHEPEVRLDGAGGEGPQGEALPGVLDGAGRDLLEAHRAPALQHREGAVQGAGHDGGVEALAEEIAVARLVPVDARALRGPALGDDGGDLALGGRVDENERLTPQPVQVLLDDAAHEQRRHPPRRTRCRPGGESRRRRQWSAGARWSRPAEGPDTGGRWASSGEAAKTTANPTRTTGATLKRRRA